ncbi:hypothetical protein [Solidesulfovibrio sp.]|uniref:hypothetical protein n=1 Tax=Solidesulfovibrio sp. TaxID=2910990 RepID=UPI00262AD67D|nr:hypothetical protein [Solidesulfovibrio sp.]
MTQHAVRLFLAAPLPLCVTAAFLAAALYFAVRAHASPRLLLVALCAGSLCGAVLAFGDALSRRAESRRVRRMLTRHGFDRRVLDAMAASRCQRDAALFAAAEAGCRDAAASHYHRLGYRWHHLLPDGWLTTPWRLAAPAFLKKSFLAFRRDRADRP